MHETRVLLLTILIPEPENPKRPFDVFLQSLIYELQLLWENGVQVFNVSCQHDFHMRVILMWIINDFLAYDMLFGRIMHGQLSCPYCQDMTYWFQLKHGRKTCWFDCRRRFLPSDHMYRRITTLFKKNTKVFHCLPSTLNGFPTEN